MRHARVSAVTFSLHVLKMGECDVAGPEVFWMGHWGEWVTLHFWMVVARAPGVTAIVNTGPPADLTELNVPLAHRLRRPWRAPARGERATASRAGLARHRAGGRHPRADHPAPVLRDRQHPALPERAGVPVPRGWIEDFHAEKFPMHVPRWHRIPRDTLQYLMFDGWEQVRLLEDEAEVLPGLRAFWAGVHHRSSMCYLFQTARGTVAASDCVFTYRNLEAGEPLGIQESLEEYHRARARIIRESVLFIPLYDSEVARRHPDGRVA